jgi:hypothetical protein
MKHREPGTQVRTKMTNVTTGETTPGTLHAPEGRRDLIERSHAFAAKQNPDCRVEYAWEDANGEHTLVAGPLNAQ